MVRKGKTCQFTVAPKRKTTGFCYAEAYSTASFSSSLS